jgi:hypothetical protein
MPNQNLPARAPQRLPANVPPSESLAVGDVLSRARDIHAVMSSAMTENVHFGKIPGCDEPSLWKPGAEKIAMLFGIAVTMETIEEQISATEIYFRVRATATARDGHVMGSAEAVCSTQEKKYRWRRPVCKQEFDEAGPGERRETWALEWYGPKGQRKSKPVKVQSVRTEVGEQIHTLLSMAQKRAYVALIRSVTAASDIFAPFDQGDKGDPAPEEPVKLAATEAEAAQGRVVRVLELLDAAQVKPGAHFATFVKDVAKHSNLPAPAIDDKMAGEAQIAAFSVELQNALINQLNQMVK